MKAEKFAADIAKLPADSIEQADWFKVEIVHALAQLYVKQTHASRAVEHFQIAIQITERGGSTFTEVRSSL